MGTTLTAVYVGEQEVAIAHVGDSRAYCLRDGELLRLTDDHSLVDELMRQGRLTPEEAVEHPQRSVITRALGPEATVEVDTRSFRARAGDVYLLCSDGLTTMISEEQIADALLANPRLRDAGRALIAAANEAGGRDNITVVLMRLEEVAGGLAASRGGGHPTMTEVPAVDARPADAAVARTRARRPRPGAARARAGAAAPAQTPAPRRACSWPSLVVLGVLGAGAYLALQSVYFIGTNSRGLVTLYQGLPYRAARQPRSCTAASTSPGVSASTLTARTPPHAAGSLAALGSQRRGADPQPGTGAARMRRAL